MAIQIYNPGTNQFVMVDPGAVSQENLLLNILIELRVQTSVMLTQNNGLIADDINALRIDQVNDPVSLTKI